MSGRFYCKATTRSGRRCLNGRREEEDYCGIHAMPPASEQGPGLVPHPDCPVCTAEESEDANDPVLHEALRNGLEYDGPLRQLGVEQPEPVADIPARDDEYHMEKDGPFFTPDGKGVAFEYIALLRREAGTSGSLVRWIRQHREAHPTEPGARLREALEKIRSKMDVTKDQLGNSKVGYRRALVVMQAIDEIARTALEEKPE